jgi:hypothetical protein
MKSESRPPRRPSQSHSVMLSEPAGGTPLQRALEACLGVYSGAVKTLATRRERDTLRDVLCARVAADYVDEVERERSAA